MSPSAPIPRTRFPDTGTLIQPDDQEHEPMELLRRYTQAQLDAAYRRGFELGRRAMAADRHLVERLLEKLELLEQLHERSTLVRENIVERCKQLVEKLKDAPDELPPKSAGEFGLAIKPEPPAREGRG